MADDAKAGNGRARNPFARPADEDQPWSLTPSPFSMPPAKPAAAPEAEAAAAPALGRDAVAAGAAPPAHAVPAPPPAAPSLPWPEETALGPVPVAEGAPLAPPVPAVDSLGPAAPTDPTPLPGQTMAFGIPVAGGAPLGGQTLAFGIPSAGGAPLGGQTLAFGVPSAGGAPLGGQTLAFGIPVAGAAPLAGQTMAFGIPIPATSDSATGPASPAPTPGWFGAPTEEEAPAPAASSAPPSTPGAELPAAVELPATEALDDSALEVHVEFDADEEAPGAAPAADAPPSRAASDESRQEEPGALLQRAAERIELDDYSGALALIERVLACDPSNGAALELQSRCEATLLAMLESKLGDLAHRPRVQMKTEEIVWLNLDHRAGFLLSQIDGTVSLDDLFALSSMSRLETAQILVLLMHEKVIR